MPGPIPGSEQIVEVCSQRADSPGRGVTLPGKGAGCRETAGGRQLNQGCGGIWGAVPRW